MTERLFSMLRLGSAALPIGAFAYSQGLECAIAEGMIRTAKQAEAWICGVLQNSIFTCDIPLIKAFREAFDRHDRAELLALDSQWRATRGTRELRDEDRQLACALMRLLAQNDAATGVAPLPTSSFGYAFAYAGFAWSLDARSLSHAYCFSWLEAQLGAAVRLMPLGQTEAQRAFARILDLASCGIESSLQLDANEISSSVLGQVLCSARHELLYSRLFRS